MGRAKAITIKYMRNIMYKAKVGHKYRLLKKS